MMIVLSERYSINFCTELGLILYFALLLKGTMNFFCLRVWVLGEIINIYFVRVGSYCHIEHWYSSGLVAV